VRKAFYTVVFTTVLCGMSAGAITAAHVLWDERQRANIAYERNLTVLDVLGLLDGRRPGAMEVREIFRDHVDVSRPGGVEAFQARSAGEGSAWAVHVEGMGRQGPIRGVLGIGPDRKTITALRFYEQQETPGYGGRIASAEFIDQFPGKTILAPGRQPGIILVRESRGPNQINAITGATVTSVSVAKMINRAVAAFVSAERLVELDIRYPRAVLIGDPPAPPGSTAKPPPRTLRPPVLVPDGTRNLAIDCPVTAADEEPIIGQWRMITDGEKEAADGGYVECGPMLTWVQIDLGQPHRISYVLMWHYFLDPLVHKDVIVQVADDADFTRNVRTIFNNDHDNSADIGAGDDSEYFETFQGRLIDAGGLKARYVRTYCNGSYTSDMSRFTEVEVYGR